MVESFLYTNPVAPAVVGLFVFTILGWYVMTRREIARGELPEGPPAAHPFALFAQSLLVLLRERRILVALLLLHAIGEVASWPMALSFFAEHDVAVGIISPNDPSVFVRYVTQGSEALRALKHGLPGCFKMLNPGPHVTLPLAIMASCLLLYYRVRRPEWMSDARLLRALLVACLSLAGAVIGGGYYCWRRAHADGVLTELGPYDLAASFLAAPAYVLVALFPLAAAYELVANRVWTWSDVSRRVLCAYFPWLGLGLLMMALMQLSHGTVLREGLSVPDWINRPSRLLVDWLPVVLFPLPWVLLERERGLIRALEMTVEFLRENLGLLLCFSMRLAAMLWPAIFILNALAHASALGLALLCHLLRQLLAIAGAMIVCRAYVSIVGREDLAPGSDSAGEPPPEAEETARRPTIIALEDPALDLRNTRTGPLGPSLRVVRGRAPARGQGTGRVAAALAQSDRRRAAVLARAVGHPRPRLDTVRRNPRKSLADLSWQVPLALSATGLPAGHELGLPARAD